MNFEIFVASIQSNFKIFLGKRTIAHNVWLTRNWLGKNLFLEEYLHNGRLRLRSFRTRFIKSHKISTQIKVHKKLNLFTKEYFPRTN